MGRRDQTAANDPLWRRYELSVRKLLASVDPTASVRHNHHVPGRLSGSLRQVDVWVTGTVAGIDLNVAVECKRHRRAVDVSTVDQFVGKLLDIGADRGVLYSYSGFQVRLCCAVSAQRIQTFLQWRWRPRKLLRRFAECPVILPICWCKM
jgi:hypothetical protein